jgi:DNA-binding protein H-NS
VSRRAGEGQFESRNPALTIQDSMTKTYIQIQKQIETLQREADKLKRKEVDDVIAKIKEAIRVYELTAADLGFEGRGAVRRGTVARKRGRPAATKTRSRGPATVKFRDEAGNTWGGRGPRPQWLRSALAAGKSLQDFQV